VDLLGDIATEVVGLEALHRRLDDPDPRISGAVVTLPRKVRLIGFRDSVRKKSVGPCALHDIAHPSNDCLRAAHTEGQRKVLICSSTVPGTDECWARAAEKAV